MDGQQENRDLSALYESVVEEGIMSRMGARTVGIKAGTGQYFKNIGSALTGKAAPISAGDAARNAKVQSAYKSATKNLLNDLQKLGLIPKEQLPQQTSNQVTATLASLVGQMQQAQPAKQTNDINVVPASAPGQSKPQPVAASTIQPAAPVQPSKAAQRRASQTKSGAPVDQLPPDEEAKFKASLPAHPLTSRSPVNPPTRKFSQPAPNAEQDQNPWQIRRDKIIADQKKQTNLSQNPEAVRSRRRRAVKKASKASENNEDFAFSSALPFKKFFPINKPTIR